MTAKGRYDVVVVGGGIGGSLLAGVLARAGLEVLVVEKTARFRDIVRGEGTFPWGVSEARRLGVESLIKQAGGTDLVGMRWYDEPTESKTTLWAENIEGVNEVGFTHPRLQEVAFAWARNQGASAMRPVKVTGYSNGRTPTVTAIADGVERLFEARLVVGADGKRARTREWTGGTEAFDPEHHRFGGVAVSGVRTDDRDTDNVAGPIGIGVNWFAQGESTTRLYLMMTQKLLRENLIDRSFDALVRFMTPYMPEGALEGVHQEGPIGFFNNADTWATRIAGNDVVLIGDAAGSPDPTEGHGTSLVYRDVRELSDLLLDGDDWTGAVEEFAQRRLRYFEVIRELDRWKTITGMESGERADRLREGHKAAEEADPTLGGFGLIETHGPDGLTADEEAKTAYFGDAAAIW